MRSPGDGVILVQPMDELWLEVRRRAKIPDHLRIARALRAPEVGPRVLFLSGGSALRAVSRHLKQLTHNSIHLITPFDSGGSSALLREAFSMPSIGDLRNRLLSLADESVRGNPEVYRLLAHRFSAQKTSSELVRELAGLIDGSHPLVTGVPDPIRPIIQTHLRYFQKRCPANFDLRGANIGNLLLSGGYLENERDIQSVLYLFSKLLETRGIVHPSSDEDRHLAVRLQSGETLFGQAAFTGKTAPAIASPVEQLFSIDDPKWKNPVDVSASEKALKWLGRADLICYPVGSFYSSVACHLLLKGVGTKLCEATCPKVYVPNMGSDPEQLGMTLSHSVEVLCRLAQADYPDAKPADLIDFVLIDPQRAQYSLSLDIDRVRSFGIRVIELPLARSAREVDPQLFCEALLSLC